VRWPKPGDGSPPLLVDRDHRFRRRGRAAPQSNGRQLLGPGDVLRPEERNARKKPFSQWPAATIAERKRPGERRERGTAVGGGGVSDPAPYAVPLTPFNRPGHQAAGPSGAAPAGRNRMGGIV